MNKKPTFFLDMDGVIADFCRASLHAFFGEYHEVKPSNEVRTKVDSILESWPVGEYDICRVLHITPDTFWQELDYRPYFWETIPTLPTGFALYNHLTSIGKCYICTSPSLHSSCVAGKLKWLQDKFGYKFRDYIFTTHKHLLAGKGILIDDYDKNVDKFRKYGGDAILYPQIWNSAHEYKDVPLETIKMDLETLLNV